MFARYRTPEYGDHGLSGVRRAGNANFDDRCPPHQFLIGAAGQTGLWINQLRIICAPILPDGTHGQKYYGPLHGTRRGAIAESTCPPGSIVYGTLVNLTADNRRVAWIDLFCTGASTSDRQNGHDNFLEMIPAGISLKTSNVACARPVRTAWASADISATTSMQLD